MQTYYKIGRVVKKDAVYQDKSHYPAHKDEYRLKEVQGHIFTCKGLEFGMTKINEKEKLWEVTELSTGLAVFVDKGKMKDIRQRTEEMMDRINHALQRKEVQELSKVYKSMIDEVRNST